MANEDVPMQLHRQFAIAQYLYNNITDEDKERLLFDPDTGRWSGYKHPYGFKVRLCWEPENIVNTDFCSAPVMCPTESNSSIGTAATGKTLSVHRNVSIRSWTKLRLSATT